MILPACLGILLVGIVMLPSVFAAGGCGEGTVLVDGVCQLAPVESSGCGEGTVLVNGVCQLSGSSGTSIPPLYIAGGAAAIGAAIIGIVFAVKRGSGTPNLLGKSLKNMRAGTLQENQQRKKKHLHLVTVVEPD